MRTNYIRERVSRVLDVHWHGLPAQVQTLRKLNVQGFGERQGSRREREGQGTDRIVRRENGAGGVDDRDGRLRGRNLG